MGLLVGLVAEMRLVASLIVQDEMHRYLPLVIGHLRAFSDQIVVLDDGSADGTGEWLDEQADDQLVVHHLDREDGFFSGHEGRKRQQLLLLTLNELPDYVLAIDADEFISNGQGLRNYMDTNRPVGTLEMKEVWKADDDALYIRHDGAWRPHPVPILWNGHLHGRRGHAVSIAQKALACGREPEEVRRMFGKSRPTEVSILHFGWANERARQERYDRYVVADGGRFHRNAHIESIMFPDTDVTVQATGWPTSLPRQPILAVVNS